MGGSRGVGSDDDFRIRQVLPFEARFCCWARWARVFTAKSMCYISVAILALSNSQRGRDKVDSILYKQLLCVSQLRGFHT